MTFTDEAGKSLRVALLAGGDSSEREISLLSGESVGRALRSFGFDVTHIDPASKDDLVALAQEEFDLAFLTMHGKHGEDGTLQGMLELLGVPYTGSGVWSSATAIDKAKAKDLYRAIGVPTPNGRVFLLEGLRAEDVLEEGFSFPCVVKVTDGGSSIGVTVARELEELEKALREASALAERVLIEEYISGREFTVSVIGNDVARALPAIEFRVAGDLSFEAKYVNDDLERLCPAPLSSIQARTLARAAEAVHTGLECAGLSRTDFLLSGDETFWALETNTVPGMRRGSFAEQSANAAGISYEELCMQLVTLALDRGV